MAKKTRRQFDSPKPTKSVDPHKAFYLGRLAKGRGFVRFSPFYEDVKADGYWYAGFDGKTEEEMGLALIVVSGGMATPTEGPDTTSPGQLKLV